MQAIFLLTKKDQAEDNPHGKITLTGSFVENIHSHTQQKSEVKYSYYRMTC